MRYLIALMLLWTTASFADHNGIPFDEKQLPMFCGDTEHILEGIKSKYAEEVVMMAPSQNGQGHDLFHSLWINAGSTTWSFIVVNKQVGVTCIIASGDNMRMMLPPGI